jgi:hypothetical protein
MRDAMIAGVPRRCSSKAALAGQKRRDREPSMSLKALELRFEGVKTVA